MKTVHILSKPVESRLALRRRNRTLALGVFAAVAIPGTLAILLVGCGSGASTPVVPPPVTAVQPLQAADVPNIVQAAVNSVNVDMVAAGVGRARFLPGVFRHQHAPST